MRAGLRVLFVVMIAAGVLFTGQGVGLVPGSFMTGRTEWAVIGALLAAGGALALWWSMRPRV
jgi:hypothetical protein